MPLTISTVALQFLRQSDLSFGSCIALLSWLPSCLRRSLHLSIHFKILVAVYVVYSIRITYTHLLDTFLDEINSAMEIQTQHTAEQSLHKPERKCDPAPEPAYSNLTGSGVSGMRHPLLRRAMHPGYGKLFSLAVALGNTAGPVTERETAKKTGRGTLFSNDNK